jgi:16S rRNA C967 or C1407 C5-methylase (RsmB/RsmF family)
MHRPFREHHLLQILDSFEEETLPLDVFLRAYFRRHTAVGSKDRKEICETIYGMIRWLSLIDYLGQAEYVSWEARLRIFLQMSPQKLQAQEAIPAHIRASFPKALYQLLTNSLGEKEAFNFCITSNAPAPTTIRTNLLKTTRDALLEQWQGRYRISLCKHSPAGIRFEEKINFFGTEEFKAGFFEVQDEASQLAAELIAIKPGERFLDYCAGSGGKSLAIAPKLQGRGQLFLHDIRPFALQEAKKRLKRAGIQNAQPLPHDSPNKNTIKGRMDWVLVDAPCSGTGTLRRNPDMKWKFTELMLENLIAEQRQIFKEAITYLKPGGHIVYTTCSVLPQENQQQAAYFLEHFPLEEVGEPFSTFPLYNEMDGFFGVVFKKRRLILKAQPET